jgi:hypothetical protein
MTTESQPSIDRNTQKYCAIALMACALLGAAALLHHPTLADHRTDQVAQAMHKIARVNSIVHGVMIGVLGLLSLCFHQYSVARQTAPRFLPASAAICFHFGAFSLMLAGLINGFVVPDVIQSSALPVAWPAEQLQAIMAVLWSVNQHLTSLGACWITLAIAFWALDLWRSETKRDEVSSSATRDRQKRVAAIASVVALVMTVGLLQSGGQFSVRTIQYFWLGLCIWCGLAALVLWSRDRTHGG